MECAPAYTGGAMFTALVILDLIHQQWTSIPGHILFGIFVVLLLIYICQSKGQQLGWILLSIPLIFILLGWLLRTMKKTTVNTASPATIESCPCTCCSYSPCKCKRPCQKKPNPGPCIKPTLQS